VVAITLTLFTTRPRGSISGQNSTR
jgi:hypothetical protein